MVRSRARQLGPGRIVAGDRSERVTIQQPVAIADAYLGQSVTWTTVATVWAAVMITTTQPEQLAGLQVQALVSYSVTVPYSATLAGVDPSWRLVWGDKTLQIQAVEDVETQHRYWRFACREVQA